MKLIPSKLNFKSSTFTSAMKMLRKEDQTKLLLLAGLQSLLGFLDLVGVALIGVIGALSVSGVQSSEPGNRVSSILKFLQLSEFTFQSQVAVLAIVASAVLILRTMMSVVANRKTYHFLGNRGALITSNLFARVINRSLLDVRETSTQKTLYSITSGVQAVTMYVLGATVSLLADISLTLILFVGLIMVSPPMAILTLIMFVILGLSVFHLTNSQAHRLGYRETELTIASNDLILEVLNAYRELLVKNLRTYYSREVQNLRVELSRVSAEMQIMPNYSKYILETGLVLGAVVVSGIQFVLQDARQAVATLVVFLAAGARLAPAVMRIQQNLIQVRSGTGLARPTFELIDSLRDQGEIALRPFSRSLEINHMGFAATINLSSIFLQYAGSPKPALDDINMSIKEGSFVAIVGPSGAGKSSLIDVILGVIPPTRGKVLISGLEPLDAISRWSGAIGYVPQEVYISDGTIRSNVALGFASEDASDELVWSALRKAQLSNFVESLPKGLDSRVGEKGTKLSVGQRQRLGIARAMFTKPKLIIMDEATSALDGQTEFAVSNQFLSMPESLTRIVVAHRLSTIQRADEVFYVQDGKIVAKGTFNELRQLVPDFDAQAKQMGL